MMIETVLSRSLRIMFSGGVALGMGMMVAPVQAQQADTGTGEKVQRVEITGSNIRRTDKETPSPVQVLSLQDLKNSGYNDTSSILRNLTANGQGTLTQANPASFASGAAGVALRGLTVGATLVLVDGHRMAPYALSDDGQRSFVDVSAIPFEAIDHIEVLKDGASSTYGSDAMAGVVNIILKKQYVGSEITAEVGTSQHQDGTETRVAGIHGWGDLEQDGHNAYFSVEYRKQKKIRLGDRQGYDWTNTDWSGQGGVNQTYGVPNASNGGQPRSITGYFVDPNTGAISGFLPGCNATMLAAGQCAYKNPDMELQPETQNTNVVASWTQKLGGDWKLNMKGSLFNSKSEQVNNYPSSAVNAGGLTQIAFGPGINPTVVPASGALFLTVPATYPGNTTGTPQLLQYNFANMGPSRTGIDADTWRFAADLSGSIGNWDTKLAAGYSKNTVKQTIGGAFNLANLQAAFNDPVHPYLVGQAAAGNTAAQNAFIAPTAYTTDTDVLEYVTASANRDLMDLQGGPLSLSVGIDFTHRELNAPAPVSALDGSQLVNNAFAMGNQNVSAAFFEVVAPVLKNLELDASARYDKYSGGANSTSPKFGFKYQPVKEMVLRGTYTKGFRAPNPAESGSSGQSFLYNTFQDPVLCGNNGPDPTVVPGNFPQQCAVALTGVQLPSKKLQPEKSKSYTLGLILEPTKDVNLSLDYYNIRIDNQIISTQGDPTYDPTQYVVRSPNPQPQPFVNPDGTIGSATPAVGNILFAPFPYENAQYTQVSGLELDGRWTLNLNSYGKLTAELMETHTIKYEQSTANSAPIDLAGTHGPSGVSGDTGNPRDRAQFTLTWDRGPWTVAGTVNWISSFSVVDPSQPSISTCQPAIRFGSGAFRGNAPTQYCTVASFTTLDLHASYQMDKNWRFSASILNAANTQPPLDFQTYGGAGATYYNPALHQSGAVGRFFNIAATYTF